MVARMFENHMPDRPVVEVEVEGEREICVGIHQAIKYRSLAAADAGGHESASGDEDILAVPVKVFNGRGLGAVRKE
jgi:hypothetical protein